MVCWAVVVGSRESCDEVDFRYSSVIDLKAMWQMEEGADDRALHNQPVHTIQPVRISSIDFLILYAYICMTS